MKTIGGLRFWRCASGKDVTFKIDRVRLLLLPPGVSEKAKERLDVLTELQICFKKIKESVS